MIENPQILQLLKQLQEDPVLSQNPELLNIIALAEQFDQNRNNSTNTVTRTTVTTTERNVRTETVDNSNTETAPSEENITMEEFNNMRNGEKEPANPFGENTPFNENEAEEAQDPFSANEEETQE